MAKPYPKDFRDDGVGVARKGHAPLLQIARDFGISEGSLADWVKQAEIGDGRRDTAASSPRSRSGRVSPSPHRMADRSQPIGCASPPPWTSLPLTSDATGSTSMSPSPTTPPRGEVGRAVRGFTDAFLADVSKTVSNSMTS